MVRTVTTPLGAAGPQVPETASEQASPTSAHEMPTGRVGLWIVTSATLPVSRERPRDEPARPAQAESLLLPGDPPGRREGSPATGSLGILGPAASLDERASRDPEASPSRACGGHRGRSAEV